MIFTQGTRCFFLFPKWFFNRKWRQDLSGRKGSHWILDFLPPLSDLYIPGLSSITFSSSLKCISFNSWVVYHRQNNYCSNYSSFLLFCFSCSSDENIVLPSQLQKSAFMKCDATSFKYHCYKIRLLKSCKRHNFRLFFARRTTAAQPHFPRRSPMVNDHKR